MWFDNERVVGLDEAMNARRQLGEPLSRLCDNFRAFRGHKFSSSSSTLGEITEACSKKLLAIVEHEGTEGVRSLTLCCMKVKRPMGNRRPNLTQRHADHEHVLLVYQHVGYTC